VDTSGIEPDPSRKYSLKVLSERDNQLHHVPSEVISHRPHLIWSVFVGSTFGQRGGKPASRDPVEDLFLPFTCSCSHCLDRENLGVKAHW